ncbi:ABC transporter substrate-binding protein [Acrocarpospora catenulata]|uniref:ABC transporter substrate-binding protein n=1 Tax=Acrocarpospora catenulata TaxID=2836182 RepID=UPI001BDA7F79|nr:ABC transporter substrate-binding protein [Acrocarpospora catenulata]
MDAGSSRSPINTNAEAISALHDKLPADIRDRGEMIVATDASYPPCDYLDPATNKIAGFNHDILMAIAPRLGITIKQESIAFDGLLPGVQSGRYSAAMECITDNQERQKQVMFVDYAYAAKGVLTTVKNPGQVSENPLSLCGLKAGVQTGTEFVDDAKRYSENCVKAGKAGLNVTNFPTAADQNTALQSGRLDLVFTDVATGAWQKKESGGAFEIWSSPLMAQTYVGIVVDKDNRPLAEAILGALEATIKDGTYQKVMDSWGLSHVALTEPGINLATERPLPLPELCGACGK